MAISNAGQFLGPIGPLKDKRVVDISTNDFEDGRGFVVQVATAGALAYRTLEGDADQSENGLAKGAIVNVAGVPVLCRALRASSTVTSVVVGYL